MRNVLCGFSWKLAIVVMISMTGFYSGAWGYGADPVPKDIFSLSLEELMNVEVTSAGFFRTTTSKAPGYVMVYDMDTIADSTVRTLSDLIDFYVPGSAMGTHERQGRLIGTRGILIDNNAKTLVMWDGQNVNYRMHFGYMIGMLSPLLGDVQKVEVIHGPGAIQHGSGAINGFINLIPKTGLSHPGFFTRYEYGITDRSNLFEAGYGFSYGEDRNVYVYGGGYDAKGFEPDTHWGNPAVNNPNINAFGFAENNYRFSTVWNHGDFNLNFFTYEMNPYKNNDNERGYFRNETLGIRPQYTLNLTDTESLELIGSILWMDFADFGTNDYFGIQGGSERHMEFKSIFRTTHFDNHSLAVGFLAGQKKFNGGDFYFSATPDQGFESVDTKWYEYGIFAEDMISLSDQWTLSLGLRYDKYRTSTIEGGQLGVGYDPEEIAGHFSPRAALAYQMDDKTVVKASYQHGFRMPDAVYYDWNLFNNAAADALGFANSPGLVPEEMDSFEVNLQKVVRDNLTLQVNGFYNIFKDQLSWGPLENAWSDAEVAAINAYNEITWGGGMFQNIEGKFQTYGTEVVAEWDITDRDKVVASYSFVKVNNNEIEQHYPTHQIKINLMHELIEDKLLFGVNYLFQSRFTRDINPIIHDAYESSRNVFDLSMIYRVNDRLRFKGVVKNIFGDKTPPMGFRSNQPSWGSLGYDEPRVFVSAEMTF